MTDRLYIPPHLRLVNVADWFDLRADNAAGSPCQDALREIIQNLPDLDVQILQPLGQILTMPDDEAIDTVRALLGETDCTLEPWSAISGGLGQRSQLIHDAERRADYTTENGTTAQVLIRITHTEAQGGILFENQLAQPLPDALLRAAFQRAGVVAATQDHPLGDVKITLIEATLNRNLGSGTAKSQPEATANPFFRFFDWIFGTIDKTFAGGEGDPTEALFGPTLATVEAVTSATEYALNNVLHDNLRVVTPTVRVQVRCPLERQAAVQADFAERGGVVEDEVHDGTIWTLTGRILAPELVGYIIQDHGGPTAQLTVTADV